MDAVTTATVKARLFAEGFLEGLKIDVVTEEGVVYLRGDVDNIMQRERAEAIARSVEGVTRVRNGITVGVRGEAEGGLPFTGNLEPEQVAAIQDGLADSVASDPDLKGFDILFDVNRHGAVEIYGRVDAFAQKRRVEEMAWRLRAVQRVINKIHAADEGEYIDVGELDKETLLERIMEKLRSFKLKAALMLLDQVRGMSGVHVDVDRDEVALTGDVDNYRQYDRAEAIAAQLAGARQVANRLQVGEAARGVEEPDTVAPPKGPGHAGTFNEEARHRTRELRSRLQADAKLKGLQLAGWVTDEGVAFLVGGVPSAVLKRRAETLAWNLGVEHVVNGIEVGAAEAAGAGAAAPAGA